MGGAEGINLSRKLEDILLYFGTLFWIEFHDPGTKKADPVIETAQIYRPAGAGENTA